LARLCYSNESKDLIMYTITDFRVMPFHKKCDLITFHGTYVFQRMLGDCKVFLYDAGGFFAEVFYSPKYQKVLMINAFDKAIGLEPYLDEISLEDLNSKTCM
jgi:hypothetical protein